MAWKETALLVLVFCVITAVAWWIVQRLLAPSPGPTEEQRRIVAMNFMKGAKLMGRCSPLSSSQEKGEVAGQVQATPGPPGREDLRAALAAFDEALAVYPNDFSIRFLKAQALEEVGELGDALAEIDWLLRSRSSVKPGFFRRMGMALGIFDVTTVAPLGTALVSQCDTDILIFHVLKRRGRVLLKKQRLSESMQSLRTAMAVLDKRAWNEEMERRGQRVSARVKGLKREDADPPPKQSSSASTSEKQEQTDALLPRATGGDPPASRNTSSSTFDANAARVEVLVLLARCQVLKGSPSEAQKSLAAAKALGVERLKDELEAAMKEIEESGTKVD